MEELDGIEENYANQNDVSIVFNDDDGLNISSSDSKDIHSEADVPEN